MAIKSMIVWAMPSCFVGPFVVDVDFGDVDLQYDPENNTYTYPVESSNVMYNWGGKYDLFTNFSWVNEDDESFSGYRINEGGEMLIMRDPWRYSGINPAWSMNLPELPFNFEDTSNRVYYNKFIGDYNDPKYTDSAFDYFPEDWVLVDVYNNAGFEMLYELRANDGSGEIIYPKFTND